MSRKIVFTIAMGVCFFLIVPAGGHAQSSLTRKGLNGAQFDVYTSVDTDYVLESIGGTIGYSIGGILDVGAVFKFHYDIIEYDTLNETEVGLHYGILLLKQRNYSPVSLEISGDYSYAFIESDYYSDQDLQKEGHGYNLGIQLLRDFAISKTFRVRIGMFGGFRSYNYTIEDISPATAEMREFSPEREIDYSYGPILVFFNKNKRGSTFFIGFEPLMNGEMNLQAAVRTGLVFEFR